ncbi:MAG: rRNA maturation RNase YbeY [Rhodospirillales bacterium]|nr:rRNA maturation RNase YbeY [Rhodospirillales bacterium]
MKRSDGNVAAAALDLDVLIEEPAWLESVPDVEVLCRTAAEAAWSLGAPPHAHAASPADPVSACVLLASDDRVRALNRDFRGRDVPTDVLSFPAFEPDVLAAAGAEGPPPVLGDIVIALQTTLADAAQDGKTVKDHLRHLVVHGILHLLGYDHERDADAAEMEALEVNVLSSLGIKDPYGSEK